MSKKESKSWKRYSNAGGVGLGTLAVFLSGYSNDDLTKEIIAFISPALTYLSAILFSQSEKWINYAKFKIKIRNMKSNLKSQQSDPHVSDQKKRALQKEYDELCNLENLEIKDQIKKLSAVKNR